MIINFENESKVITEELKHVKGFLDCEKVILHNLKKQIGLGFSDSGIEAFMKKLVIYFEGLIKTTENIGYCINYRYATGFLDTLIVTPYLRSWIKTINL